ncbi:MAG: DNA repair protein RadC [Bacilli bacterium]|nr:DNA repair protein RadC [Bacilli bacterium]
MRSDLLPKEVQPREKAKLLGIENLNNIELLAIIIGSGTKNNNSISIATEIISQLGGLNGLINSPLSSFSRIKGIGFQRSLKLKAVVELSKRLYELHFNDAIILKYNTFDQFVKETLSIEKEFLCVLSLNRQNKLINKYVVEGEVEHTNVLIDEVLKHLVASKASKYIILHNHPSGNARPSKEDLEITNVLIRKTKVLNIELLDNIIHCKKRRFSFKDHGLLK